MTRSDVTLRSLVKQSSCFSRKHRTLSLQICVHQTVRLTTEFLDWCRNVCTLHKRLSAIPAAVTSDLKQRLIDTWASMHIAQRHRQSSWSIETAVTCKHEGKRTSLNIC